MHGSTSLSDNRHKQLLPKRKQGLPNNYIVLITHRHHQIHHLHKNKIRIDCCTMAVQTRKSKELKVSQESSASQAKSRQRAKLDKAVIEQKKHEIKVLHLAPLPLVLTVLLCSGVMWMLSFRDVFSTGRPILGDMDASMLHFTKSTEFFDISKGFFKSKAGGLSAISSKTTDENRMGGLFIRKIGGAMALAMHSQKLFPLLFHSSDTHFSLSHFTPMLVSSAIANLAVAAFQYSYLEDLKSAESDKLALLIASLLVFEALVMTFYAFKGYKLSKQAFAKMGPFKFEEGKTARSIVSRIVMRTVLLVSGGMAVVAGRDLLFPGTIIPGLPRDDIYLEWTNAFLHSPPPGSPEFEEHILEAPLYVGEKFIAQLTALYILISCMYKFVTAVFIRSGTHSKGLRQCKVIWKVQFLGDALLLFLFRLFAQAAKSASLDLRWHLMALGYQTLIIGLYAHF